MPWVAVTSTPAAQRRVCYALGALRIDCFAPAECAWRQHRNAKRVRIAEPLFAGYTFARAEACQVGEILDIEGVRGVLRSTTGKPFTVPDAVIEALRQSANCGLFDRTKVPPFANGEPVRILEGPFAGMLAKVKSATARHRPRILLKFLGQLTEAEVPIDKIERIRA